jgi:hypothetical protein
MSGVFGGKISRIPVYVESLLIDISVIPGRTGQTNNQG